MTAHPTYSGCGLQPDRHGILFKFQCKKKTSGANPVTAGLASDLVRDTPDAFGAAWLPVRECGLPHALPPNRQAPWQKHCSRRSGFAAPEAATTCRGGLASNSWSASTSCDPHPRLGAPIGWKFRHPRASAFPCAAGHREKSGGAMTRTRTSPLRFCGSSGRRSADPSRLAPLLKTPPRSAPR